MQHPQSSYFVVDAEQDSAEAWKALHSMVTRTNWSRLVGANVDVYRNGRFLRTGRVDMVTGDGEMAWIGQNGVDPRFMIDKAGGYELYLHHQPPRATSD